MPERSQQITFTRSAILLVLLILLSVINTTAQECAPFQTDTMSIPGSGSVSGEYLETKLRNESMVRILKTANNKLYLRIIVTRNFYFNKIDMLEIKSGNRSYYVKNTKQHKIDKTHGLFVTEIFRNYLGTLKEYGITGIVFGGAETDFTKQDASQVKEIAKCIYQSLDANK